MPIILAIEPDRRQAAHLTGAVRQRVAADLVLAETTEEALDAIGNRVPDMVLVPALLSPQEDAALAAALRLMATAAHIRMLTIPVLANGTKRSKSGGILGKWRRGRDESPALDGCDPSVFADQINAYLEEAAAERAALQPEIENEAEPWIAPIDADEPIAIAVTRTIEAPLPEPIAFAAPDPTLFATPEQIAVEAPPPMEEWAAEPIEVLTEEPIAFSAPDPIAFAVLEQSEAKAEDTPSPAAIEPIALVAPDPVAFAAPEPIAPATPATERWTDEPIEAQPEESVAFATIDAIALATLEPIAFAELDSIELLRDEPFAFATLDPIAPGLPDLDLLATPEPIVFAPSPLAEAWVPEPIAFAPPSLPEAWVPEPIAFAPPSLAEAWVPEPIAFAPSPLAEAWVPEPIAFAPSPLAEAWAPEPIAFAPPSLAEAWVPEPIAFAPPPLAEAWVPEPIAFAPSPLPDAWVPEPIETLAEEPTPFAAIEPIAVVPADLDLDLSAAPEAIEQLTAAALVEEESQAKPSSAPEPNPEGLPDIDLSEELDVLAEEPAAKETFAGAPAEAYATSPPIEADELPAFELVEATLESAPFAQHAEPSTPGLTVEEPGYQPPLDVFDIGEYIVQAPVVEMLPTEQPVLEAVAVETSVVPEHFAETFAVAPPDVEQPVVEEHIVEEMTMEEEETPGSDIDPWAPMHLMPGRMWPALQGMQAEAATPLDAIPARPEARPIATTVVQPEVARPKARAGAAPRSDHPEWLDLIASLRQDIARRRVEPEPVSAPPIAARSADAGAGSVKRRVKKQKPFGKKPRPLQDEWGLFDPDQCGFSALLAKLEEITSLSEEADGRRPS
jgi:hypothetical protein